VTDSLNSLRNSRNAHLSWAKTADRAARTAKARRAANDRFMKLAGGDAKRAESLRQAHYKAMTIARLEKRKARKDAAAREAAETGDVGGAA
jgi:hypothetical protein